MWCGVVWCGVVWCGVFFRRVSFHETRMSMHAAQEGKHACPHKGGAGQSAAAILACCGAPPGDQTAVRRRLVAIGGGHRSCHPRPARRGSGTFLHAARDDRGCVATTGGGCRRSFAVGVSHLEKMAVSVAWACLCLLLPTVRRCGCRLWAVMVALTIARPARSWVCLILRHGRLCSRLVGGSGPWHSGLPRPGPLSPFGRIAF